VGLACGQTPTATIRIDASKTIGDMKGMHRDFSGGFAALARTEPLRSMLHHTGAGTLRLPIFRPPHVFKGETLEDARNPAMYDFTEMDQFASALANLVPG
jgi:hypothetical protein